MKLIIARSLVVVTFPKKYFQVSFLAETKEFPDEKSCFEEEQDFKM